ncbi:hypothetical protein [Sediminitomix flava]|uniref:Cytochrome c n=1 Tax=Sediminitomix flava TaxID=379075 RepID=A0A315Z6V1_SEDFL|nr:hypothetical protein [Sediminitomix flava]PWJ38007.1 hypothetical protein BC781_108142 [Sediminitomix flava]
MIAKLKLLTYSLLIFITVVSCQNENNEAKNSKNQTQQSINPNGDSELALLMRAMFDEAELVKKQITNGEPIKISLKHDEILTAEATQAEKVASMDYKAYANVHLQNIKKLKSSEPDQLIGVYDNLIKNCISCHQALCPGPIVKIKKLQQNEVNKE